ncbi:MAG TPA: hypothetical protein ENJ31_09580, partial [Anaerolineae bacterium]|nr:hypothetical protein [Anaerolineae bacterium]
MRSNPKIGVLCSRVRVEEKAILAALRAQSVDHERIDPRNLAFDLNGDGPESTMRHAPFATRYNAILIRCLSHSRAYYLSRWLEGLGVPTVSPHRTVATCGDKMLTSAAL